MISVKLQHTEHMNEAMPKTIEQIRAGRRWRLMVGHEPMTDEATVFMFMDHVEKLLSAAEAREAHNGYAKKHGYLTHLGKQCIGVRVGLDGVYAALDRIARASGTLIDTQKP